MTNDAPYRRTIQWPGEKLVCCTFSVALEAFHKTGRFKMDPRIDINFSSLSHAEYGGNVGVWRILEILERQQVRAMILVNSLAAEKWPDAVRTLHQAGHEIAGHGTTNETSMVELDPKGQEKEIDSCTRILEDITGTRPVGWFGPGGHHTDITLGLLAEAGYLWSGDPSDDDIPYVASVNGRRICVIPKTWYANDWRAWGNGLGNAGTFFAGYKDGFDFVYGEAKRGRPSMIDACVHAELGGRPYLAAGFERIIEHVNKHRNEIWQPTYREIAEYCLGS